MPFDLATYGLSVVTAGGGAAAIGYGVFKALGAKWMDNRFARQLEKSKQDHATATEHLRFKIAGLLDRTAKLNQREFEVLPDIWGKADAAYNHALALISPMRSRPDFSRMSEAQFEETITRYDLPQFQVDEIRGLSPYERGFKFHEAVGWVELHRARQAAHEFVKALSCGSIYVHPDTYSKIGDFANKLTKAVSRYEMNQRFPPADPLEDDAEQFRQHGQAWFDELADYVRNRYWRSNSTPLLSEGNDTIP